MLVLKHSKLEVYKKSRELVVMCYQLTEKFPSSERFGLSMQIRRSATSIKLNVSEGASRKTANDRRRFYEIARGSLVELHAALEIALDLGILTEAEMGSTNEHLNSIFAMLSRLIESTA